MATRKAFLEDPEHCKPTGDAPERLPVSDFRLRHPHPDTPVDR